MACQFRNSGYATAQQASIGYSLSLSLHNKITLLHSDISDPVSSDWKKTSSTRDSEHFSMEVYKTLYILIKKYSAWPRMSINTSCTCIY